MPGPAGAKERREGLPPLPAGSPEKLAAIDDVPHGTFITGGTERVIVSQLVRSPGVYFDRTPDRTSDKEIFGAKIVSRRNSGAIPGL